MLIESNDIMHANCWAEIDLAALEHNVRALRFTGPELMAVLKADAYGHSVGIIAPELVRLGVAHFGVATASEGAQLRDFVPVDSNIYVMTAAAPADSDLIALHGLIPFVSTDRALFSLSASALRLAKNISVHLEVDTGIGRAGIEPSDFLDFLNMAQSTPGIVVTGVCTHFTCGEDKVDATAQNQLFERCLNAIPVDIRDRLTVHAANSPGILNVPAASYDLMRPGLLLYGIAASPGEVPSAPNGTELKPVLSLYAHVILVRRLPAGTPISYGRTFVLDHPATIATIGIGYGDGYSRHLSNIGKLILPSGAIAPIVGRVCMDQLCVEVPDGHIVTEGDVVTLLGVSGENALNAADIAGLIDATPHEITTCITSRVRRIAVKTTEV